MCKRTMYKRARIPMFLWERRACSNSGAQAVFPRPRKNGLGIGLCLLFPVFLYSSILTIFTHYSLYSPILFSHYFHLCGEQIQSQHMLYCNISDISKGNDLVAQRKMI